jgi:prophage DNA circulation protein
MAYKDDLLPASFREIPFYIKDTTMDFGQRVQVNQYPFADTPNTKNLGRRARQYTFNAYVIGEDYIIQRNALLNAIEDLNTPGILTHPTLGIKYVYATDQCQVNYSNQEGGIETFKLIFVEAGLDLFPSLGNNSQIQAAIEAAEAAEAIASDFESRFATKDYPSFVGNSAKDKIGDLTTLFGLAAQTGVSNQDKFSKFTALKNDFIENLNTNISDPNKIGGGIKDLSAALTDIYDSPNDAYNAQLALTNYGKDYYDVAVTTPTSQQEADNQNALVNIGQNLALTQLVASASKMTFESRQDAQVVRDQVCTIIQENLFRLAEQGNDEQFGSLSDLRAKFVADITARSATLKNAYFISITDSLPVAVFCYDQYQSLAQYDDLIKRNNIRHPLFIPPLTEMEVLK